MNRYVKAGLFLITAVLTSKIASDLSDTYDAMSRSPELSTSAIMLCVFQVFLQIAAAWMIWSGICLLAFGRRRKLLV